MDQKLRRTMLLIILSLLSGMTLYEFLKQLIYPEISIWESHAVTIVFSTLIGSFASYYALKKYERVNKGLRAEITRRQQVEEDLSRTHESLEANLQELQEALKKVSLLSGLLPICASCKKIRTNKGEWESIEKFIEAHSEAEFSHSICDACARILYPEEFRDEGQ